MPGAPPPTDGGIGDPPADDEIENRRAAAEAEAKLFGGAPAPVRVGRFEIRGRLGHGGLGVVYEAHDPELDRRVALKLLRPDRADQAVLEREARALARLAHPNVVAVHDVGAHEGRVFVAMERVDGSTLRRWCTERPRTTAAILDALAQAGAGLAAAHEAGLVHGDFKPENVLVARDGRVRVTDFGLARPATTDDAPLGAGTPAYMAPELRAGAAPSASSDQWAFCTTAHEAITGARPDDREPGADPPDTAPVPRRIWRALVRGLARDPSARWPSMRVLLQAIATDDPGAARRRTVVRAVVTVVLAIALLAALLQIWMFADWMSAARARRASPEPGAPERTASP